MQDQQWREVSSEEKEDELKLEFTYSALHDVDPFATHTVAPADVAAALAWQADRSPEQVLCEREEIMRKLEAEAGGLWHFRFAHVHCCCAAYVWWWQE